MSAPQTPSLDEKYPRMRRIDLTRDNLTPQQRELMDKHNKIQYEAFRKVNSRRTTFLATGLFAAIAGIYSYTIYQMSKDNIIKEMEEEVSMYQYPEK